MWHGTIKSAILESKILSWKVKFEIYFPKWKVVQKVSVEPWDTYKKSIRRGITSLVLQIAHSIHLTEHASPRRSSGLLKRSPGTGLTSGCYIEEHLIEEHLIKEFDFHSVCLEHDTGTFWLPNHKSSLP